MKASTPTTDPLARWFMGAALALARRGLGNVWPNPAVGCVLVRPDLDHRVVGRGWTQPGGRPHAETEALTRAGELAAGATAYVTLEPCNHTGETGPCTEALIAAGVTRVVVATEDPDPRVAGGGLARLREAGLEVETGVRGDAARRLNDGFLTRLTRGRPRVPMKLATTMDGRIATRTGDSQWITGPLARQRGHLLRARHDAILTGAGTAAADDPMLTCRLPGLADRSPARVVLDTALRTAPDSRLARTAAETPPWIYATDTSGQGGFAGTGVEIRAVDADADGRPAIPAVLADLAARGITRLLVEAGPGVSASFLKADAVDAIHWFRAPSFMGGDGKAAAASIGVDELADMTAFEAAATLPLGDDTL